MWLSFRVKMTAAPSNDPKAEKNQRNRKKVSAKVSLSRLSHFYFIYKGKGCGKVVKRMA